MDVERNCRFEGERELIDELSFLGSRVVETALVLTCEDADNL